MQLLSHPFRLLPNGDVATIDEDSDEANAEQIAILLLTRIGERELVGGFGTSDPAFAGVDPSEIASGIAAYGPPVSLDDVEVVAVDDATIDVTVRFS